MFDFAVWIKYIKFYYLHIKGNDTPRKLLSFRGVSLKKCGRQGA
ncbi:hypothetical protein ANACOL_03844 [Anaerotruncus colihominis DSM 17241]|uniref:Uncharacterized protein n=1 Tax=Anaerotruncus colihominis DSM 17241 TaxID=445972 RepID=B0PGB1_9FIRM|nr:hypothetical protein ANACOL_03844 [Anaerotruncus colihominis DSM 17241]